MILHFASTEQIIYYLEIERRITLSYWREISFMNGKYKEDDFINLLKTHQIIIERYKVILTNLKGYDGKKYEKIPDGFDFNLDKFDHLETGKSFYLDGLNYSLLTIEEAYDFLSIKRTKLNDLMKKGEIPSVKIGDKSVRIQRLDLINYIERNKRK